MADSDQLVLDRTIVMFGEGSEDYRQAEWLALKLEHEWKYDHTTKQWHHWDGVRWAPDKVNRLSYDVAKLAAAGVKEATSDIERKALIRLLNIAPQQKALEALAAMEGYGTDGEDWDQIPYLLGCSNGIVDLRTNSLVLNPGPESLVTRTTKVSFSPIADFGECGARAPLFMDFLEEVMSGDQSMVAYLLLWFGASLFGQSPEQKFLLMTGIGRNGKGALKHSIMKAVGEYGAQPDGNVYMRSKMGGARSDGARADLMDLKGRRITFFSEPEGNKFNEEMLKAHTGGDLITARTLYSSKVQSWEPTHSITFLVNNAPEVDDIGPSMQGRVMVADFRERFDGDKEDKLLYRKLEGEAEGVLAILCWAAAAWYAQLQEKGTGLELPPRVVEQSRAFMARGDQVAQAINEALVEDHDAYTRSSRLYEAYLQWHARSDQDVEAMSQMKFAQQLEKKGFKRVKKEDGNYVRGLRPKPAVDLAADDD